MPTALLSCWDKRGLVEFASGLRSKGWDLIASGGTARALQAAGLTPRRVEELTGEPEMLGGRVKTLHPAVHAAILARETAADQAALQARGWGPIDLVAVNLYPFQQVVSRPQATLEEAVEQIDIGGVALLRAAAKNFQRVTALCDPDDYAEALDPADPPAFRRRMAAKAFAHTRAYDAAIEAYLARQAGLPAALQVTAYPILPLRYGENPHQQATYHSFEPGGGPMGGELLQGKPLSYNNLLDLDAAWRAVALFEAPTVVVVKHTSPCGVASAPHAAQAVGPAIASDPVSAFGSVVACNRAIDAAFVAALGDLFVECLAAPDFDPGALQALARRSNLRLLRLPVAGADRGQELRSVIGGLLLQSPDLGDPPDAPPWEVVTRRAPDEQEWSALRFAWLACQPVKSNAVVLARAEGEIMATVGVGGGQPNRVDCVRMAGDRAGSRAQGSVLASDAFFPFPDGVEAAAALGVMAIVQPGGSRRDDQAIAAADAAGLAMIFTGVRHFRH